MTVKTITQPPFVVDTEAEMDNTMPENSIFFTKDTKKLYELVGGSFVLMFGATRSQSSITRAINGTGFQASTTRDAMAIYSVQIVATATIGSGGVGSVFLEISPNNSSWTEVGRITNGQVITLAITLNSVQTYSGQLIAYIPAGYYARLRSANTTGAPAYTWLAGQEILL